MKKTIIGIGAILTLLAALSAYSLFARQFNITEPVYLLVHENDGISEVSDRINHEAHPTTTIGFTIVSRMLSLEQRMRSGRYEISPEMTMLDVIRHLRNHSQTPVNLVVPSVRTLNDLAGRLADKLMTDSATWVQAFCNDTSFSISDIIPNTYQVYWNITPRDFIERMHKENATFWTSDNRESKATALNMTHEEVMALAAIVDEETANNSEKSRIAGLYLNRLRIGMPLQSDPTVKYAVGDFTLRRILKAHLETESPYNTYIHTGLTPTPIRIPSIAGIDAVLNHETHNYIYMCAKEDFSGTHNFAASYNEHLHNARLYAKALDARGIK